MYDSRFWMNEKLFGIGVTPCINWYSLSYFLNLTFMNINWHSGGGLKTVIFSVYERTDWGKKNVIFAGDRSLKVA